MNDKMWIRRPSSAFLLLSILTQSILTGHALADECLDVYLEYSPCTVTGAAIEGTATTAALSLTIFNFDVQTHFWAMAPAAPDDPDCDNPGPVGRWSSFEPSQGNVSAMTQSAVGVSVTLDAAALAPGSYREYGCFLYDMDGAAAVPIPVDFTVFPPPCTAGTASYSPCEISVTAPFGASSTTGLYLTLFNPTAQSYSWTILPTDGADPECNQAGTGSYFTSFLPFDGLVDANTNLTVLIEVDLDGTALASQSHHEFACLLVSLDGIDPVSIPIQFIITDEFFKDNFE